MKGLKKLMEVIDTGEFLFHCTVLGVFLIGVFFVLRRVLRNWRMAVQSDPVLRKRLSRLDWWLFF